MYDFPYSTFWYDNNTSKVWYGIMYPFPNFNGAAIEVF